VANTNLSRKNKDLGARGETLAAEYLSRLGWRILARNWKSHPFEIDLVIQQGGLLVFVEVKSMAGPRPWNPSRQIRPRKAHAMRMAAYRYLREHPFRGEIRFDLVECVLGPGTQSKCDVWEDFWSFNNWEIGQGFFRNYTLGTGQG